MAQALELLIKARNDTDAAFKAVLSNLEKTGKEAAKTNDILGKISADLKGKLGSAAENAAGNVGGLGSSLSALGPGGIAAAAAIGAVVGAVTAAAKVSMDAALAAAAYGDKIVDLANKTDLSTQSLQAFDVMARTGNTTVEAIAAASLKMQRGIVDGADAFRRLGLDVEKLKAMTPEEQFKAVAVAIDSLGTNAEKSAARVAVFGKAGDELTTVLQEAASGATELGGALSGEALQASADLQDKADLLATAWERVQLQFGAAIAQSPEVQNGIQAITDALVAAAEGIGKWAPLISAFFSEIVIGVKQAMIAMEATVRAGTIGPVAAFKEMKDKIEQLRLDQLFSDVSGGGSTNKKTIQFGPSEADISKARSAYDKLVAERRRAIEEENKLNEKAANQWDAFFKTLHKEEADFTKWVEQQSLLRNAAYAKSQIERLEHEKRVLDEMEKAQKEDEEGRKQADEERTARMLDGFDDIAGIVSEISGLFDLLGVSADSAFGKALAGMESFSNAASQGAQAFASFASGDILGGIQQGIGALKTLGEGIASIFGDKEHEKVNDMRDAYVEAAGGITELDKKAQAAGLNVKALLNAKTVKDYEAAIKQLDLAFKFTNAMGGMDALKRKAKEAGVSLDAMFSAKSAKALEKAISDIQTQLDEWGQAQDVLRSGMEKWGISIGDMGGKFAGLELDKRAQEMILFFNAATGVGANMGAVTAGMAEDVNDLVAQYKTAGLAIPESMRPMLEAMLKNKQLVDENGDAYDSFEDAGITFGKTMEGVLANIGDQIKKLMEVLARGFRIPIDFEVNGQPSPSSPGAPAQSGGPKHGEPEFARGGPTGSYQGSAYVHPGEYMLDPGRLERVERVLEGVMAMSASAHGGGGMSGTIVVPVSISNRQFGTVQANVTRRRQGNVNVAALRRHG